MPSIKAFLGGLFFDELTLTEAQQISPRFRRLAFSGPSLREKPCNPGDKVQVLLPGVGSRTYTPFAFDAGRGKFDFLVYAHGQEPGAVWGQTVTLGQRVRVFGPRKSVPLATISGNITLLGDETSFAVAKSLVDARGGSAEGLSFVFEVSDPDESRLVLRELAVPGFELVEKNAAGAQRAQLARRVREQLARSAARTLVLTGNAQSIQHVRADLKANPVPDLTQTVKAYWSAGKRGLD